MYELFVIGKIKQIEMKTCICLDADYRKGLKHLELFSHCIVFYETKEKERTHLKERVVKIESVNAEEGIVWIAECNLSSGENVFDLKPYFPCEDRVKNSKYYLSEESHEITLDTEDGQTYQLASIGKVQSQNGKHVIEVDHEGVLESLGDCTHVKIIWWFHRFDQKKYRRITEGTPPYENAPRTGVFATRSPVRPNPIAMTTARVLSVDMSQKKLYVSDIECFDQTPCIGLLPYNWKEDRMEEVRVPSWLAHWPEWLDDRSESMISGNIKMRSSEIERMLEKKKKSDYSFSQIFSEEAETVPDKTGISIQGARQNNLKGIDCMIPYHQITAVIGVSGSGKSSLVFDTIYAECQSRMSGTSDYAKDMKRPDLESMQGVIPAIAITQQDIGQNSRSTVGTYSDSYSCIRRIYATIGIRHCPECGKAICPMTEEEIAEIVREEKLEICGQVFEATDGSSIEDIVKRALENGKGALRVKRLGGEPFYLQTTQMCYECNRILFECNPATFNYSDSESMCPVCNGYGVKFDIDAMTIVEHPELSIMEGASSFWGKLKSFAAHPNANWMKGEVLGLAQKEGVDLSLPWEKLPEKFRKMAIYGCPEQLVQFSYKNEKNGRSGTIERPVVGAYHYLERFFSEHPEQKALEKYRKEVVCDACNGERLKAEGRLVTVSQLRFPEVAGMTFTELAKWCMELPESLTESHLQLVKSDIRKLYQLATRADHLGISYLEMDRSVTTLSGGEQQRLKLLAGISQNISGVLYILDEPSRGLHPKDYDKIKTIIRELRDNGNTILLVEHNQDMIQMADHILEIGPGAGEKGGYLVGAGSIDSLLKNPQSTLLQLLENKEDWSDCQQKKISKEDLVSIEDASFRNLNHISVSFPLKAMTCICGVSGSGKSSLMNGIIEKTVSDSLAGKKAGKNISITEKKNQIDEIIVVNQTAIGRTPRSVPATYMGIMDQIRVLFAETEEAREKQLDRNAFSFNSSEGQCETCQGGGMITPRFSEDIWVTCPHCNGKRYKKKILEIRYHNHNIADVLDMTIQEAALFLKDHKEISHILSTLTEVGLGYLKLGQNSASLSGGEAARLKMAKQLVSKKKKHTLYLLDEPTTGLHISDIKKLLSLFQKLVKEGNTLVMIEHNKQVLQACDWIIEVGPGAGKDGGRIMRAEAVR